MLRKVFLGLAGAVLAIVGIAGASFSTKEPAEPQVMCCGECRPGDDCLTQCRVIGELPKDLKLTCCGHCQKGEHCLEKCGGRKASCCEVR